MAIAQVRSVSGKVTDASGNPVPFASVKIVNSQSGVNADENGNFTINAKPGDKLIITSIDFAAKTVTVPVNGPLRISISKTDKSLSEVIVTTALGVKRQARELGYATTSIKTAQLTQAAVVNPATGLAAKISGVDIRLADNGVNPQVKVTFRGSRSITGNNAALVVLDGVPVDQTYLSNLNPNDIDDITILKGANAAALYGMAASNGVMSISTKRGKGKFSLNYGNTVSWESISYFPQLQNEYSGYGGEPYGANYDPSNGNAPYYFVDPLTGQPLTAPFENEAFGVQYGSLDFPISTVPIGVTANQQWLTTPFKAVPNGRKDFFQTGVGDQNKLSASFGNKWGGLFISGEHTTKKGVTPSETFARSGLRLNGNLNFGRFTASGGVGYNSTNTHVVGNSFWQYRPVYFDVINQLPSTDLKSIENTNLFQNSQGFINAYFPNPWWQVHNAVSKNNTKQVAANLQLNYKLVDWLTATARGGYSRTTINAPSYIDSINYDKWPWLSAGAGPWGQGSLAYNPGNEHYQSELIQAHYDDFNTDVYLTGVKKVNKFKFTLLVGGNYRSRSSFGDWGSNQVNEGNIVGQNIVPSGYTKVTHPDGSANATYTYKRNDQSVYADMNIGYDNWLFLHGSFRNDWTSILDPQHRSFSYPSVDMSAVLSDKLEFLKNSSAVSFLKVRVGYAGTGNVSLDTYQPLGVMGNVAGGTNVGGFSVGLPTFGAYAVYPIAKTGLGFPFGTVGGYTQNPNIVKSGLAPEKTASEEVGFQLGLLHNRINFEATYYTQNATNQNIPSHVSTASGVNTYLINAGKVNNSGVELDLSLMPLIKVRDFKFDVNANFSYQNSKVVEIAGGSTELDQINFGSVPLGGVFAVQGKAYPQLMVTDFARDPANGKIIVDGKTGLPSLNPGYTNAGNTNYKYFVGLTPSFSYKHLTLRAVFDYRAGAKILNEEGNNLDFSGLSSSDAANRQAFVVPNSEINLNPGGVAKYVPNTNVAITSQTNGQPIGDFWWANFYNQAGAPYVTSAAFIKLREMSLSYEFPASLLGTQQIVKALSVSLIGRNLFMWRPKTNIWSDPEFSTNGMGNAVGYTTEFQTPPTRIISVSVNATIF
jgi:TonB-linked SusC/RagA family outer membrane protein